MKKASNILYYLVKIGLAITILGLLVFPGIFTTFLKIVYIDESLMPIPKQNFYIIGIISFYILSIPYTIIIIHLNKIVNLLKKEEYYNSIIVKRLKKISLIFLILSVLYPLINIFLYYGFNIFLYALTIIPSIILPFLGIVLSLLFFIAAKFYENTIAIKEENDLTV